MRRRVKEVSETQFTPNTKIAKVAKDSPKGIKILDIADMVFFAEDPEQKNALDEGKIVLNLTDKTVEAGQFRHYMDVDVARRVFSDIANDRFERESDPEKEYKMLLNEYKGGKRTKSDPEGWEYVSRHLTISRTDKLKMGPAVTIGLEVCEGVLGDKKQVSPKSGAQKTRGSITLSLPDARTLALTVLEYIRTKQTAYQVIKMFEQARTKKQ